MKTEGDRGACRARRDWTSFQPAVSSTSPTHAASGPTRKSASASASETMGLELNRASGGRQPSRQGSAVGDPSKVSGTSTTTSSEHKCGSGGGDTGPRPRSGRGGWELGDEQRRPEGAAGRPEEAPTMRTGTVGRGGRLAGPEGVHGSLREAAKHP